VFQTLSFQFGIRVDKALYPEVIESGVIEKIAAMASRDHGDARKAVALLAKSAYLAEKAGTIITLGLVDKAAMELDQDLSAEGNTINVLAHSMNGMRRWHLVDSFTYGGKKIFVQDNIKYRIPEFPAEPMTKTGDDIAHHIVELIEDGATIQLGVGAIGNAVGKLLIEYGLKDLFKHNASFFSILIFYGDWGCRK